jgi:hypothetical protein
VDTLPEDKTNKKPKSLHLKKIILSIRLNIHQEKMEQNLFVILTNLIPRRKRTGFSSSGKRHSKELKVLRFS